MCFECLTAPDDSAVLQEESWASTSSRGPSSLIKPKNNNPKNNNQKRKILVFSQAVSSLIVLVVVQHLVKPSGRGGEGKGEGGNEKITEEHRKDRGHFSEDRAQAQNDLFGEGGRGGLKLFAAVLQPLQHTPHLLPPTHL